MKIPTAAFLLTLSAFSLALTAAKKESTPLNPKDPYATAENEMPPAVSASDLAVRSVVFENFIVPEKLEAKARKAVDAIVDKAVARLASTMAFSAVGKQGSVTPGDPYFLVKCTLKDYRMVGTASRVLGGALAGTSHITYLVQVSDGKAGTPLYAREISTENSAWVAGFSYGATDRGIPDFLGNVLADYLALRARTDKGVEVLALSTDQPR